MARYAIWALTLGIFAAACNGDDTKTEDTEDTEETDMVDGHPLVPDKYQFLWQYDGCKVTVDGVEEDGIAVYYLVDPDYEKGGASATATGRFTAQERWFWFHGTGDYADDCVDRFELKGNYWTFDYSMAGCEPCEEAFYITRTLVDRTCNYTYYTLMGWDPDEFDPPDEEVYEGALMLDTHTESDTPYQEDKMLIHYLSYNPRGSAKFMKDYSFLAHIYPTGENHGYPADYDWYGKACLTTSR